MGSEGGSNGRIHILPCFSPLPGFMGSEGGRNNFRRGPPKEVSVPFRGLWGLKVDVAEAMFNAALEVSVPFRGLWGLKVETHDSALFAKSEFQSPSGVYGV